MTVGDAAIAGLREVFRRRGIKAIVQGFGPMFQIYFTERDAIYDYRDYCTVCGYRSLFSLRAPAARTGDLHDPLEWPPLDYLNRAHGTRRCGVDRCGGPVLQQPDLSDSA